MVKLPDVPKTDPGVTPVAGRARTGQVEAATAQLGAQLTNVGDKMFAADITVQRRSDAIRRAQAREAHAKRARELYLKEQDEGSNFADPKALPEYHRALQEEQTKILQSHEGSAESRARLEETLTGITGRFQANAMQTMRTEQRAMIKRQVDDAVGTFAEEAADDPGRLPQIVATFADEVANYADATSPDEFQGLVEGGTALIISSVLDRQVALGNTASARELYEQSKGLLDGGSRRSFSQQITALEGAEIRDGAKIAARRARIAAVDPELLKDKRVLLAIEGINLPKAGPLTLSERIAEYEKAKSIVTGKPYTATPREVGIIAGTMKKLPDAEGTEGIFGKGASGRAHQFLAENAPEFASNALDPLQDRFFLSAVSIALQIDPNTGQPGTVPPTVREALARRGFDLRQFTGLPAAPGTTPNTGSDLLQSRASSPAPATGEGGGVPTVTSPPLPGSQSQQATEPGFAEPGSEADQPTLSPETAIQESRQFEPQGGLLAPQAKLPRKTIFELADLVTGPGPVVQGVGARIPLIGGLVEDPQVTQARGYLPVLVRDLVRVLQNNPRFAEGERKQITQDVQLEGSFFDRPERFRDNLIGMDDALALRQQNAVRTLQEGAVSRDEYRHTLNVFNAIVKFREALGVPPLVTKPEDIQALGLKSGDLVRTPDGTVRPVK